MSNELTHRNWAGTSPQGHQIVFEKKDDGSWKEYKNFEEICTYHEEHNDRFHVQLKTNTEPHRQALLSQGGAFVGSRHIANGNFSAHAYNLQDHRLNFHTFHDALQNAFPGAVLMNNYVVKTAEILKEFSFVDENTMGMIGICRDEITDPMLDMVKAMWGKTFNCCGLGGFVFMGKTGLGAATAHTPKENNIRRFVFYSMPHIAISEHGEIGVVSREGMDKPSHACGALEAIVKELEQGKLDLMTNFGDLEMSFIRQKILSKLKYGVLPDLVEITYLSCDIITEDVDTLLKTLPDEFHYALCTGVQIHGPGDSTWIWPKMFYCKTTQIHHLENQLNL